MLEADSSSRPGTTQACRNFMEGQGSDNGWCVGDGETQPTPGTFDKSPFSVGRGFDLIVRRSDMRVLFTSSHGTPRGNENLSGPELVARINEVRAGL